MPLSVHFIADVIADTVPDNGQVYTIGVDEDFKVCMLSPLSGDAIHLLKFALEYGFLSPEEEVFWRDELPKTPWPVSEENARHREAFYKANVSLELTHPKAIQPLARFGVCIRKYDDPGRYLLFRGVVKQITSVQPY